MEYRSNSFRSLFTPAERRAGVTKPLARRPPAAATFSSNISSNISSSTSITTPLSGLPSALIPNHFDTSSLQPPLTLPQQLMLPPSNDDGPNDSSPLGEAVLGLDVGMTATRASFVGLDWKGRTDVAPVIVSPEIPGEDASNSCDFPSLALPFRLNESPEVCLAYATNTHDLTLPLKMYCYFIRACQHYEDEEERTLGAIRRRIPQLDTFWRYYEQCSEIQQTNVSSHLRNIFKAHLKMIKDTADLRASNKGLRITRLAVTMPPNWDSWLEELYVKLIIEVWTNIPREKITTVYESEAVGHWFLRLDTHKRERERIERFILGDFGGHTMNTCVFQIVRPNNGNEFSFFAVREATCEHGGSELHATWVRDQVSKEIKRKHPYVSDQDSTALVKNCMAYYRKHHRKFIDGSPFKVSGTTEDPEAEPRPAAKRGVKRKHSGSGGGRAKVENVYVLKHYSAKFYEDAFKKPLDSLKREINRSSRETKNSAVMLSGGSFLNNHVHKSAERLIHKAGLTFEDWVAKNGQAGVRSSIVSIGAALAVANSMTVQEFMQRAIFAIDTGSTGSDNTNLLVTFNSGKSQWVEIDYTGKNPKQLLIACAPLAPHVTSSYILRFKTYEFWNLGTQRGGKYKMRIRYERRERYEEEERQQQQKQHRDWLVFEHAKLIPGKRDEEAPPMRWPIYYDPGACVCFIDHDKNKVNAEAQKRANIWLHQGAAPALEKLQNFQRDPGLNLWEDRISRDTAAAASRDNSTQNRGDDLENAAAMTLTVEEASDQIVVNMEGRHESQAVPSAEVTTSEASPNPSNVLPLESNRGLAPTASMAASTHEAQSHPPTHVDSRFASILGLTETQNSITIPPFPSLSRQVPNLAASFTRFDGIGPEWFETATDPRQSVRVNPWVTAQQYIG